MKKTLFTFLFLGFVVNAQENQQKKSNNLYLSDSFDIGGDFLGIGLDLNFIYHEETSFTLGVFGNLSLTKNYPSDIDNSDSFGFSGIDGSGHFYVMVGKMMKVNNFSRIRFNLSAGLARSLGDVHENFVRGQKTDDGYYYDYDLNSYQTVSLILNPKIEFPLFSLIGIQISPKIILNKHRSFYGVGFGIMLGKLRERLY